MVITTEGVRERRMTENSAEVVIQGQEEYKRKRKENEITRAENSKNERTAFGQLGD